MCLTGKFHDKKNYEGAYLIIAVTTLHNTVTDLVLFIFHINMTITLKSGSSH